MIEVAEQHYLDTLKFPAHRLSGIAVARHGYGRPTRVIPMVEAGHPIPDAAGLESAASALALAEGATADDLVLVLMSGGASANWIAPAGITLAEKQAVTRALLRSGANIGEINTVRKHLSRIKGGRLARAAASGARGDARDLRRAGRRSGGDRLRPDRARSTSTLADARAIVARFRLDLPAAVARALNDPANESPKPGDRGIRQLRIPSRRAAGRRLPRRRSGGPRPPATSVVFLGERLEGEAREVAAEHARLRARTAGRRPPRRDPVGRRTDRHDPRQGPRRAEPGIRAGARDRARRNARHRGARRRHRRHRRRRRLGRRPRRRAVSTALRSRARGNSASIRPRFLPTTIPRASSSASAICCARARPSPTSMTSAPSSLTARSEPARNPKADDADRPNQGGFGRGCLGTAAGCRRACVLASAAPIRPLPIFACATIPAAASASRSATRTPTAGPPRAGGTCRRAAARRW